MILKLRTFFITRTLSWRWKSTGKRRRKGTRKVQSISNYRVTIFVRDYKRYQRRRVSRQKNRHLARYKKRVFLSRHQFYWELIRVHWFVWSENHFKWWNYIRSIDWYKTNCHKNTMRERRGRITWRRYWRRKRILRRTLRIFSVRWRQTRGTIRWRIRGRRRQEG